MTYPVNPVFLLSRDHAYQVGPSWFVLDDGSWMKIHDVANDFSSPSPFSQSEADKYTAYHRLGLIRLAYRNNIAVVTFDAQTVELKAMEAVMAYIKGDHWLQGVELQYRYGGWCEEHYPDANSAIKRLIGLQGLHGQKLELGIFLHQHDHQVMKTRAGSMIRNAMTAWERSHGRLSNLPIQERNRLVPDLQLLSLEDNDTFRFLHIGRRTMVSRLLGEKWRRSAIRQAITESHSDVEFEEVVSETYCDALNVNSPQYDHIRAAVNLRQGITKWISYQRLTIPLRTAAGKPIVGVFVEPDQNVTPQLAL